MKLAEYSKQKAELAAKLAGKGQKMLADEFKNFLNENPTVEAISWTQYTPHFNDGDVCEFGVQDFYVKFKEPTTLVSYDGKEYSSADTDEYMGQGFIAGYALDNKGQSDEVKAVGKGVAKLSKAFVGTDDVFNDAFGDGVRVVCSADGFDVEDYDHD